MNLPKYDALIKSGPKDYQKLKYVINSIKFLIPQPSKIFLINPDGFKPENTDYDKKIVVFRDDEVFPGCDRDRILYRKNWCFATFIALFQDITDNDFYFDIQSDNFFLKPINLFDDIGRPIFFMSPQHSHYHQQYFNFSKKMFDLDRVGIDSFIIDFMMYNKKISKEMTEIHGGFNSFFEESCKVIDKTTYPTEQDCFANWCLKHHPGYYFVKEGVQTKLLGKTYPNNYTEQEIINEIYNKNIKDEVAISLHTWE